MYLIHIQLGFLDLNDIDARNPLIRWVPSCIHAVVAAAAAAIEEPPVKCQHWTELFSQRECVWQLPQFLLPGKEFRIE